MEEEEAKMERTWRTGMRREPEQKKVGNMPWQVSNSGARAGESRALATAQCARLLPHCTWTYEVTHFTASILCARRGALTLSSSSSPTLVFLGEDKAPHLRRWNSLKGHVSAHESVRIMWADSP